MPNRTLKVASIASLVLLVLSLVAGILARQLYLPFRDLPPTDPQWHFALFRGWSNDIIVGRLLWFNGGDPYLGSMTSLGSPERKRGMYIYNETLGLGCGELIDRDCTEFFFGDWLGIYCRSFTRTQHPNHFAWRTCAVSLWYPILIFSILPLIWRIRRFRASRRNSAHKTTLA